MARRPSSASRRNCSTSPMPTTCRWWRRTRSSSPTAACSRPMMRCSASPAAAISARPSAAASRRRTTSSRPRRCATLFADLPEAVDNTLVIARRCAYMPGAAQADPAGFPGGRRQHGSRGAAPPRRRRPRASPGVPGLDAGDGRSRAGAGGQALPTAAGIRAGRHRADGLPRLFPDRRRFHPVGEVPGHSRSGRAAAPAPARWSPGR